MNNYSMVEGLLDNKHAIKIIKSNEKILNTQLDDIIRENFKYIIYFKFFKNKKRKIKNEIYNFTKQKRLAILFNDINTENKELFSIFKPENSKIAMIFPKVNEHEKYYGTYDFNPNRDLDSENFKRLIKTFISEKTNLIVFYSDLVNGFYNQNNLDISKLNKVHILSLEE